MDDHSDASSISHLRQSNGDREISALYKNIYDLLHESQFNDFARSRISTKDHDKLLADGVLKSYDIGREKGTDGGAYKVESSGERPELTGLFIKKDGWTGADAAYSVVLGNQRSLWLFGDTAVGKIQSGQRVDFTMINNSAALQDTSEPQKPLEFFWNTSDKTPQALFKPDDPREWFWPGDGVTVNGKLYVFLREIQHKTADSPSWSFEGNGEQLAQIDNPLDDPSKWQVHLKQLPNEIHWGNAAFAKDGYIYAFGEYPTGSNNKHETVLARLDANKLDKMDMNSWEYWCHAASGTIDGEWRLHPVDPCILIPDGAPEMTVSQVRGIPGYFATYTPNGLSNDIVIRHADRLEGPWDQEQAVYHCPTIGNSFVYGAKAHPELATKDGEMVITYCRNSENMQDLVDHPDWYIPHAVTVMLSTPNDRGRKQ